MDSVAKDSGWAADMPVMQAIALKFNAAIITAVFFSCLFALLMGQGQLLGFALLLTGMVAMQLLLRRGWVRLTSAAMVILLYTLNVLIMHRYGSISTTHIAFACIPILYISVVMGARAGAILLVFTALAAAITTWAQLQGAIADLQPMTPQGQLLVLLLGLAVAFRMAILIKRNLIDASRQKNEAQAQFLAERERSNARLQDALAELEIQKYAMDHHAIVVKTDLSYHIISGNQKFSEISGYSPEEFVGQPIALIQSGVHEREFYDKLEATLQAGRTWHSEICHRAKDGRLFWLNSTIVIIKNDDGTHRECMSVSTDVTALREAQMAAHAANQAKSEFLANMSHEIRTPMNGVIGMVDVLRTTTLDTQQRHMVDTVHRSSMTLLQILNDILDFSKIEAGKLDLETVTVSLRETVETVAQLMDSTAAMQQVDFSWRIAPDLPELVRTDPTRVRQILFNLLGNALKFSQEPGVDGSFVRLQVGSARLPGDMPAIEFRIADNGIGMAPEAIERLFEAFTQADVSTARKYGGTGLGLSITHRLVVLLGGKLHVDSVPGEGTEFTVLLPLLKSYDTAPTPPAELQLPVAAREPGASAAQAPLILLVEDNLINRDVILEQLGILGYAADWAWDGEHGLALWRTGRHALVLTDCHMPEMDGFQMTAAIRAQEPPERRTPIVAITANSMRGEAQRCIDAGMDDYLSKPVRLQELGTVLGRWLPLGAAAQMSEVWSQDHAGEAPTLAGRTEPVWDPDAMVRTLGLRSEESRSRMMYRFAALTRQQLQDMQACMVAGDLPGVAALAHNVKSSARTMGALYMGQLTDLLEASCEELHEAAAKSYLAQVVQAFEDIQGHLAEAAVPGPEPM